MTKILKEYMKKNNIKSKVGNVIEMVTVATDQNFGGKGIGTNLTRLLVENGTKNG